MFININPKKTITNKNETVNDTERILLFLTLLDRNKITKKGYKTIEAVDFVKARQIEKNSTLKMLVFLNMISFNKAIKRKEAYTPGSQKIEQNLGVPPIPYIFSL